MQRAQSEAISGSVSDSRVSRRLPICCKGVTCTCRYNDDVEMTAIEPAGQFRASQHSRYSDTAVPLRTGDIVTPTSSFGAKTAERASWDSPEDAADYQAPVLFNKYALDRDESMRGKCQDPNLPPPAGYRKKISTCCKTGTRTYSRVPAARSFRFIYSLSLRKPYC